MEFNSGFKGLMRLVVMYKGRDSLESHKVYKEYIFESKPYLYTDSGRLKRKHKSVLY